MSRRRLVPRPLWRLALRPQTEMGLPKMPTNVGLTCWRSGCLKVIALGPVHGYAIAQRLQQVSRGVVQVPQGSLYPAWRRLENRGFLAADWKQTETGREARFYRLTRKGRAHLETEAAS